MIMLEKDYLECTIVVYPSQSSIVSNDNTIIGNTVLYGATSVPFASGAGERFAVRNLEVFNS